MPKDSQHSGPQVDRTKDSSEAASSSRATYNVVTDTVTGVNVRWSDNKFQAIFIFFSVLVCAGIGALLTWLNEEWKAPWFAGAIAGIVIGLIVGVIASGTILMIYRAVRHIGGKHD